MSHIEKIRKAIKAKGDALIITSDSNRFYASGFNSSAGFMLISECEAVLYLDFRYYEMAVLKNNAHKLQPGLKIVLIEKKRKEYITEFIENNKVKRLLCEDKSLTVAEFNTLKSEISGFCELCFIGNSIEECRYSKDDEELSKIRKAQEITDKAFSHILGFLSSDVTETGVALEIESFMRRNGADCAAFETISVSGTKSSLPHGRPENIKLSKGFLTMDFGARVEGYCSDMTRTVCIGKPTDEMIRVYNTVLEAQKRALTEIFEGCVGKKVDAAARDFIYSCGYKGCFGHSTGHSLGIDVHEMPGFSPSCDMEIPKNVVISVEPGIYIEGKFGVRIEDIVNVTEFSYENFTKSSKDLIII